MPQMPNRAESTPDYVTGFRHDAIARGQVRLNSQRTALCVNEIASFVPANALMKIATFILMLSALSISAAASAQDGKNTSPPTPEPDWSVARAQMETYIRSRLVDPESAKITWTKGFRWGSYKKPFMKRIWGWVGCGAVNARNRLGGYTGQTAIVVVYDANQVLFSESDDLYISSPIAGYCSKNGFPAVQPALASLASERTSTTSVADELAKLAKLRAQRIITDAEFQAQKAKLLGK